LLDLLAIVSALLQRLCWVKRKAFAISPGSCRLTFAAFTFALNLVIWRYVGPLVDSCAGTKQRLGQRNLGCAQEGFFDNGKLDEA
jgi:hypothetical protein